jgi:PAS domain S-box-containing protein
VEHPLKPPAALRLLVVEDNADTREYLQACLEDAGLTLTMTGSGDEGIAAAQRLLPDAILLDLSMPGMDGLEVCRKLKSDPLTRRIAIVALSVHTEEQKIQEAFEAGADDYVVKPFRLLELRARIDARVRAWRDVVEAGEAGAALPVAPVAAPIPMPQPPPGPGPAPRPNAPVAADSLGGSQAFFSGLPEGVVVTDRNFKIRYANLAAARLLGQEVEVLQGADLLGRIGAASAPRVRALLQLALSEQPFADAELSVTRADGEEVILLARASLPREGDDQLLLTLRDVTRDRQMTEELRRTKSFFENLIDTSVDAIIASDLKGNVILFNKGAERILGYRAEEVVGKKHVSQLYPPGVAQEIMAQLRQERGGMGRLSTTRKEALSKGGEVIPIQLTAWAVMEDGQEVATAGIFHDLRERLGIERKLSQAQEKLLKTEKQAMIAELAGATAHELNQPLTSVLGYAELAKRKLQNPEEARRILDIIIKETERMAEIVRKVGHITRYETKSYVGGQRIVDLDRSSEPE